MNVQIATTSRTEPEESVTLDANDRRRKLIITSQSGDVYVNFSTTAGSDTAFDIKLSVGTSYTIDNYIGPCKADSAGVRYVEFF